MKLALFIAIIVVIVVGYVALKAAQDAAERNSRRGDWAIFVARWLTGGHWTGRPQTNAGWKRTGTKALTQTGFALPFYFRPRFTRMFLRWLWTFGPLGTLAGFIVNPHLTASVLITLATLLVARWTWKLAKSTVKMWHRREWLDPVHESVAPRVGKPLSATPRSWIDVETDENRAVKKALFHIPSGFNETETQRNHIAEVAGKRLGMEAPETEWNLSGKDPTLLLRASTMPSDVVRLKDVIDYIRNTDRDELVLGLGKQSQPVQVSLHDDSPHIGASMGAGAGKSTLARFVAAQALHKGAIVIILDIKRISHPWARGLPNVSYCDTAELIHNALLWIGGELNGERSELDRRNEVALYSMDVEERVAASVGPRILVIAEELNMTANRLRSYWKDELNGQGQSPALTALQDVAFAGRQVRMNLFMVGQMLTARVTGGTSGGGEARENVGIRMLARYTKRNWEMLVPEFPMPPNSRVLGRIQVVASGDVRETQAAYITGNQARDLATSGVVSLLPEGMPGSTLTIGAGKPHSSAEIPGVQENTNQTVTDLKQNTQLAITQPVMQPVTLAEAVNMGLTRYKLNTLRTYRRTDPTFPKPVDRPPTGDITAHYYDPVSIAEYKSSKDHGLWLFSLR